MIYDEAKYPLENYSPNTFVGMLRNGYIYNNYAKNDKLIFGFKCFAESDEGTV